MKKKLNILGRKVPILAVMMALLVIGTASAALISNYATLTGDVTVTNPISVAGDGDSAMLDMTDDAAGFTITNTGTPDIDVEVVTTLYLGLPTDTEPTPEDLLACEVTDLAGITITVGNTEMNSVTGLNPVTMTAIGGTGTGTEEYPYTGITIVPVIFDAVPGVVTGVYTIQVAVNPVA